MANLDNLKDIQKQNDALKTQRDFALGINDLNTARAKQDELNLNNQLLLNEQLRLAEEIKKGNIKLNDEEKKELNKILESQKGINTQLGKEYRQRTLLINTLKTGLQYLAQSDKIIKNTVLNLGMSGVKAAEMRASFEGSAGYVARLGGNLEDIQRIMEGYADETGRARVMSAEMVKNITAIGKGTGLGVEAAARLGAQFEIMGIDATRTTTMIQSIVDTTERMGVNTTKVLKNINSDFKKLNTYTFQSGVKGIAQMAANAELLKVDMKDALNAADIAKNLEGAIGLAAQLQVMGGEFSKSDPFEWMYLARNEPDKLIDKISEMTRGIVTFKKNSDGTFEEFISPADRDRLAAVGKSLGISAEAITEIAQRRAVMDKLSRSMAGQGLTGREKELVAGAAIFNSKTAQYEVQLAGKMRDITSLTKEEANSFVKQTKSLEERAKEAQTFEDAFKATINELKSALLPILRAINSILTWARPTIIKITEFLTGDKILPGWLKVGALFITAGGAWKGITYGLQNAATKLQSSGKNFLTHALGGKPKVDGLSGLAQQRQGIGQGAAMAGKGKMFAGAGAGIGAAALGAGAGVGAAAAGISLLADAMSKLDVEKAKILAGIVRTIGVVTVVGIGAAVALMAFGTAAGTSAVGIGALGVALAPIGVAVLAIGAGIGAATAGIGYMYTGIGNLVTGVGKLVTSFSDFKINKDTLSSLVTIASVAPSFGIIGNGFNEISAVMSGSKEDFIAVQNAITSIGNANFKGGGMLADLANLMKSPLKVEFADKSLMLRNDITLEIDGQKFMNKAFDMQTFLRKYDAARSGQEGAKA